jgi:hypothetical protein
MAEPGGHVANARAAQSMMGVNEIKTDKKGLSF